MSIVSNSKNLLKRQPYAIAMETPRANWFQRLFCVMLDFVVGLVLFAIIVTFLDNIIDEEMVNQWFGLTDQFFDNGDPVPWYTVFFYINFAFYRPVSQGLFHQTFAERLLGIYVANTERTQLRFTQVLKRHLCPFIIWACIGLQFYISADIWAPFVFFALLLWVFGSFMAFGSERRTLLDRFSGSYVYKKS